MSDTSTLKTSEGCCYLEKQSNEVCVWSVNKYCLNLNFPNMLNNFDEYYTSLYL